MPKSQVTNHDNLEMTIVTNHSWWLLFVVSWCIQWTSCFKRWWGRSYWCDIYVCEEKTNGFKWGIQCSYQMNIWPWAMNFEHEQWACELNFDEQEVIFYEWSWHVYKNNSFVYVTIFSQLNQWNIQFTKNKSPNFFWGKNKRG